MKAVRIHEFGGSDRVTVEEVPMPKIAAGHALVKVRAAAVNPVDWMIRERIYNPEGADRVPLTLGQDFSGVIERVGRGPFRAGDEVFGEVWGSFAEYVDAPVKDLVRKPRNIDFVVAASIPMPALTAWQSVLETARAAPGMTFLIHGASGGVGSFAAQFARLHGARVIATASRASLDYLRDIGVDQIIDYQHVRFEERIPPGTVDVVIDPLGGDTQARSWALLKQGGMLINLVGEIDHTAARSAGVRGVEFGMRYDTRDLEEIAGLVERGQVKPHITQVLPLDRAREALDLNQHGKSHGKIVLTV